METIANQTVITKDPAGNKLHVTRKFDAPRDQVWNAWTQSDLLDQWWAPKPWKARTKSMNFNQDGTWLYCMEGPEGENPWCRADFETIAAPESYTGTDAFCDEQGNISGDFPQMHWDVRFSENGTGTVVDVELTFPSEADLEKIVEMGFKEGFTAAHTNLDELLARNNQ